MSRYSLDWSFGLKSITSGKYLNFEKFGGRVDCTGTKLRKKNILFLEDAGEGAVVLRTWLGTYLRLDEDGNVCSDGARDSDNFEECHLLIGAKEGTWTLKGKKHGNLLQAKSAEVVEAFQTDELENCHFKFHLAMHPQISLKNIKRQRYVVTDVGTNTLTCNADQPFGTVGTINLIYQDGSYALQSAETGLYLNHGGQMADDATTTAALFSIEFEGSSVAFKSAENGKYLTSLGGSGLLKATKSTITADEKFEMQDSWPQVTLKSVSTGLYVSYQGNTDMAANKKEPTIFQMESQDDGTWVFKTMKDNFLGVIDGGLNSQAAKADDAANVCAETKFTVNFLADNKVTLQSHRKQFLETKMNKQVFEGQGDGSEDASQFVMTIVNRPKIALRGTHGFVNKTSGTGVLQSNQSTPFYFDLTSKEGGYEFDGWTTDGSTGRVSGAGSGGEEYKIELHKESKMAISFNGKYLKSHQNGDCKFDGHSVEEATLWEY